MIDFLSSGKDFSLGKVCNPVLLLPLLQNVSIQPFNARSEE
jgi:hypothetical protein